jgi:hypothetical protein
MQRLHPSPRTLALSTGTISVPEGTFSMDCAILDFSGDAACVLVPVSAEIPAMFLLSPDGAKTTYSCVVRWRIRNRIGVAIEPRPAATWRAKEI